MIIVELRDITSSVNYKNHQIFKNRTENKKQCEICCINNIEIQRMMTMTNQKLKVPRKFEANGIRSKRKL